MHSYHYLLILSLLITATLATSDELWNRWKQMHNKQYENSQEEVKRRAQWEHNIQRIQNHNLRYDIGLETYTLGLNQFADWSSDEFKQRYLSGLLMTSDATNKGSSFHKLTTDVPDSIDWRYEGLVRPVKDQGSCGSCWAFATAGAMEGQYMRKYGVALEFSEQQLVDCSNEFGNIGCDGGLMEDTYDYLKHYGIELESDYKYQAKVETCKYNEMLARAKVLGYSTIVSGDEEELRQMVGRYGPTAVAIEALDDFHLYEGGIYKTNKCTSGLLNHAVLAVGYGTENNADFWIVKNSWGSSWGERGFFRMARNQSNMCGIASRASIPIVKQIQTVV